MSLDVTVDIVLPAHNEEVDLEHSVRRLHTYLTEQFPLPWRLTVVENASTDRSWEIARRMADELDGVSAMHVDAKGRGGALRAAWLASTADLLVYMDVDLSTGLDALLPLVAPLMSGHSDLATGTRLAHGSRVVRGAKREAISRGYNLLLRLTLRVGFSDAQCGFKAIRADIARLLVPLVEDDEWFFDAELLILAEHNSMRIFEVPVDWVDDADSRVELVTTASEAVRGLRRMIVRLSRPETLVVEDPPSSPGPANAGLAGQLVRFGSIGIVSTVGFAALFALLLEPLGAALADIVALTGCAVVNTAANRRLTFELRGRSSLVRHHLAGLAVMLLPLTLNLAVLWALDLLEQTSLGVLLLALTIANGFASLARFALLRGWVFRSGAPNPAAGAVRPESSK